MEDISPELKKRRQSLAPMKDVTVEEITAMAYYRTIELPFDLIADYVHINLKTPKQHGHTAVEHALLLMKEKAITRDEIDFEGSDVWDLKVFDQVARESVEHYDNFIQSLAFMPWQVGVIQERGAWERVWKHLDRSDTGNDQSTKGKEPASVETAGVSLTEATSQVVPSNELPIVARGSSGSGIRHRRVAPYATDTPPPSPALTCSTCDPGATLSDSAQASGRAHSSSHHTNVEGPSTQEQGRPLEPQAPEDRQQAPHSTSKSVRTANIPAFPSVILLEPDPHAARNVAFRTAGNTNPRQAARGITDLRTYRLRYISTAGQPDPRAEIRRQFYLASRFGRWF